MISVVLVSDTVLHRVGITRILESDSRIGPVGAVDAESITNGTAVFTADIALIDLPIQQACLISEHLAWPIPKAKSIALGVAESPELIVTCAEAGLRGYVPPGASADDLITTVVRVAQGELVCSPPVAAALMKRVSSLAHSVHGAAFRGTTPREREILELVALGLTNRAIADQLGIELSTVKTHVHNLLEKLGVERRGEAALLAHQSRRDQATNGGTHLLGISGGKS